MGMFEEHRAHTSLRYGLEVDGVTLAEFQEVSTITIEQNVIEQKVSSGAGAVETRKYPGKATYGDITFKRGLTEDDQLYRWIEKVSGGEYEGALKGGAILQFTESLDVANRWNFEGGWPSKWELSGHKAGSTDTTVESMTIKVSRIWKD